MINRDFPNHDVKENVKDFPNHELCRVIVQKQYPFDQNNCTSIQTIAAHFEQLLLTENKSNHGESGKISFSYTTNNLTLCYMDTDSLVYNIKTEDFYEDIAPDVETRFDTSGYSKEDARPLPIGLNTKVIGLM